MEYWPDARFLTLTYADEYLPDNRSLNPEDLQLFNKRLRKALGDRKIKYYACGEYGEKGGRPHYHGIYFGLMRSDMNTVENAWRKGRIQLGTVTAQSINYVTAYITKKLWGDLGKEVYGDLVPPFSRMSKGLGERWLNEHKIELLADLGLRKRGKIIPMPRYYFKKIENDIPEELREYLTRLKAEKLLAELDEVGKTIFDVEEIRRSNRVQTRRDLEAKRALDDLRNGKFISRQ